MNPTDAPDYRFNLTQPDSLARFCEASHAMAREKGWHEQPRSWPELRLDVVLEIAAARECLRDGRGWDETWCECRACTADDTEDACKPEGVPIELADAAIRLADAAGAGVIELEVEDCLLVDSQGVAPLDEICLCLYDETPDGPALALGSIVATCEHQGIDLPAAIDRKMRFNATRSHRHGGKRL